MLEWNYNQKEDGKHVNSRYIEGVDYVFVPYAGTNRTLIDFKCHDDLSTTELEDFILKAININRKYLFVLDDDGIMNGREGKKADFYKEMQKSLGEKVYKLEAMEIENIAPKEVVIDYACREIKDNISFTYYSSSFNKADVVKYLHMTIQYKSYKNKKMYEYLNTLIVDRFGKDNLRIIVGTKNGFKVGTSLKNKERFFNSFRNHINNNTFNHTSASSKLLQVIYSFIESDY